jgi:DNA topoisomerase-6 subunit B
MDTSKNRPDVVETDNEHPEDDQFFADGHGTRVEIELVGKYLKGDRSVDQYIQLTAIANPHARFEYLPPATASDPEPDRIISERTIDELPEQPEEIKPHPHGIELGTLISMLERTGQKQLGGFFSSEFCRVGPKVAQQVTAAADLTTRSWIKNVDHAAAEKMYKALQTVKVMGPPTNCLSPIGVRTMLKGLEQGLDPDFITASSRTPAVYRGRPFIIEVGVAFGGNLPGDEQAKVYRFANRVPLQYQQSACASFKSVLDMAWRGYGLQQPKGSLPIGPMVVMIHMASVWVPFTSESKEAIADYDEIRKEMKLALQDCGRKLGQYLRRKQKMKRAGERRGVFQRYIGEVAKACSHITGADAEKLYAKLLETAERKTAEFDAVLDEEGRFVKEMDRLEKDETVVIRREAKPPAEATDDDASSARSNGAAGSTLFGNEEEAPKPRKKRIVKKKTKKKVKRR